MFQVGDRVVYGIHGICRILDQEEQLVNRKRIRYFFSGTVGSAGNTLSDTVGESCSLGKAAAHY